MMVLSIVSANQYDLATFTEKNKADLADCIEDYIQNFYYDEHTVKIVSECLAETYHGRTKQKEIIKNEVALSIYNLQRDCGEIPMYRNVPWESLRLWSTNALLFECLDANSDDDDSDSSDNESQSSEINCSCRENRNPSPESIDHVDIPRFDNEPEDIGLVLDYILVRWLHSPVNMIRTWQGYSVLTRYANDALEALQICLSRYDHDYFRATLRALWQRRAQQYFNGRNNNNNVYPYIPYYYSAEDAQRGLYTYDFPSIWQRFRPEDWEDRNPSLPRSALNRLFDIYYLPHAENDENEIFANYEENGITSAQLFLESRIDEFYRILFFFLELRARGIRIDENDFNVEGLPHDFLIHMIVENDTQYRGYLLEQRRYLENTVGLPAFDIIRQEDLIRFMIDQNSFGQISSTTTSSTTTITSNADTTGTPPPSAPGPSRKRKKDDCYKNEYGTGKYFRTQKSTFPNDCCSYEGPSTSKQLKTYTESCLRLRYNYVTSKPTDIVDIVCSIIRKSQPRRYFVKSNDKHCGSILYGDEMEFPADESSFFLKTITTMSEEFTGLQYNTLRRR